jgi:ribonucleoside-diphosphate reductase alpha chain
MAKFLGPFDKFAENREEMLRVMRNHRRVAFNAKPEEYERLAVAPLGISPEYAPAYLLSAARESWNKALDWGERYGYRNAQVTVLAPTGTIGLLMDCATTGVEPDFALVKFKKLAGGGYFKIVNESVPMALKTLGYSDAQILDIVNYLKGHATLKNSPALDHDVLRAHGFNDIEVAKVEKTLAGVFELSFAFNVWALGEECLQRLGFTAEQYNDPLFNLLLALGFTSDEMNLANEFVCGAMTIEGAPHLKKEHYAVFDTANKNGKKGQRYIHYLGHIRMMAAVQPFLSGSISKTVNMPNEATIDDVKQAYMASWKLGLKANAIYRDGCKLSQPLSAKSKDEKTPASAKATAGGDPGSAKATAGEDEKTVNSKQTTENDIKEQGIRNNEQEIGESANQSSVDKKYSLSSKSDAVQNQIVDDTFAQINYAHDGTEQGAKIYIHGEQRRLPFKRSGLTIKSKVQGQKVFLRTGEYPDGKLGEIFIDMYKEGAAFRSVLNLFAVAISTGLQYGVPLDEYVEKFTFTRFEPSGMTDHPNIRSCTSIIDLVFRILGMEYMGRTDFVQVKPKGIQKNRAEQMARLAAEMHGQHAMNLPDKSSDEVEKEKLLVKDSEIENQMSLPGVPAAGASAPEMPAGMGGVDQQLSGMMGDAPPCPTCGHITIRNGSCYKCLNCGSTTGCS